jgi:hypothetical protein
LNDFAIRRSERRQCPLWSLKPAAENVLQKWPVSKRLNSSRAPDDDPTLIDKIAI